MNKRIIRVTGNGKMTIKPNLTRVSIVVKGNSEKFDDAINKSSIDTDKLKSIIESLGFDRKDIKTISLDIDPDYERYTDKDDNYRKRFIGYKYTHNMYIKFPIDNKVLSNLVFSFIESNLSPEFSIDYTIDDESREEYRAKIIEQSVQNAKEKAYVLAKAAGVKLGDIINIDYSDKALDYFSRRMDYSLAESKFMRSADSIDFDIEPDDIAITDNVNIVWEIL